MQSVLGIVITLVSFAGGWFLVDALRGGGALEPIDVAKIETPIQGYQYLAVPEAEQLFDQFMSSAPEAERYVEGKTVKRIVHEGRIMGALVGITMKDVDQSDFDEFKAGFSQGAEQLGPVGEMELNGSSALTASGPRGAVVGWQHKSAFIMVTAQTLQEAQTMAKAIAIQVAAP